MDEIINELGTDINSEWNIIDGDISLVTNDENLSQATINRLNTPIDSLEDYYSEYGSVLHNLFGWKHNEVTLEFIKIILSDCLKQDPRYTDPIVDLEYLGNGELKIEISNTYNDGTDMSMSYVLSTDGNVKEY